MRKISILSALIISILLSSCATMGKSEPVEIKLKATEAVLLTSGNLVLESDGNVGYWESVDDIISWDLDVPSNGEYQVFLKVSCDPEFPGSIIGVTIGDDHVETVVLDSGAWADYKTLDCGTVNLKKGATTVKVQAKTVENRFVGNLMYVLLKK